MADLLVRHPADFAAERRYVLDVVLGEWLGLSYGGETHERAATVITLRGCGGELVLLDDFFARAATAWLERHSMPKSPLPRWNPNQQASFSSSKPPEVPVLFGAPISGDCYLDMGEGRIVLGLDVLGSIFFMLTRYEERVSALRDKHDRFSAEASLAHHEGLLERPIANEYLEILWSLMRYLWPSLRRRQRVFKVSLEHDVDTPFSVVGQGWVRVLGNALGDLTKRRGSELMIRRLMAKLVGGSGAIRLDPSNTFDFIMATSERHGLRSTFFVKAAASDPRFDDSYPLNAPHLTTILTEIHSHGHGIGLHPSYLTYRDSARLGAEFAGLRDTCERLGICQAEWGGRQHYLRFAVPETWRHYAAAGLAYDATLAFADRPGFRCGTCYDFSVYDLDQRRPLPLYECPPTVMEVTLLSKAYLGLTPEAALERIVGLALTCRRFSGGFRLLWHNSELITGRQRRFYASVVSELAA